ncbi:hypothetical protein BDZ91DRAFT_690594 [Kalaharituber pfeilii]|nr:hypothetical protein BDZ91DRAFT_690594 [Kalaharituber pfeilii]
MNSSVVECMDTGRARVEAQNPTSTCGDDNLYNSSKVIQDITEGSHSSSKEEMRNVAETCTKKDSSVEEIQCAVAALSLDQPANITTKGQSQSAEKLTDTPEHIYVPEGNGNKLTAAAQDNSPRPIIVVSAQHVAQTPTEEQKLQPKPLLVDDPDPRLVDALGNPRDRPFILKLEQDVITFISGSLDSFDTPPINSYYRMLVHKIAEFYRLTHIASPDAIDCVRLFRGNAARIPAVKLTDIATSKPPPETPQANPQMVKIMRRKSPSDKGGDGASDHSGSGKSANDAPAADPSRPMTREEKEAAYQLARARIFGDFKESPPESPSPSRGLERPPLQRRNKDDDGFQSRSHFYPVPPPFPTYDTSANRFAPIQSTMPGFNGQNPNPNPPPLNPAANTFNPKVSPFMPGRPQAPTYPTYPQQYPVPFTPGNGYPLHQPLQTPHAPYATPQPSYSRPTMPPAMQPMNGPMMRLPAAPQGAHGLHAPANPRFPPVTSGFVPPTNSQGRGYPQFNRIPDQPAVNGLTYQNQQPYFGHANANMNSNMNGSLGGSMNGGWPGQRTGPLQPGGLQQGDGSLTNGHYSNFGAYGLGRG